MAAAMATQKAPKVSRPDCTFTGPNRSNNVPSAMRTKMVDATDATPAFAIMPLHAVPDKHSWPAPQVGTASAPPGSHPACPQAQAYNLLPFHQSFSQCRTGSR